MKLTTIICHGCDSSVEKPKKEIDRQRRNGKTNFYCSLKCAATYRNNDHLLEWMHGEENKKHLQIISHNRVDEYTGFRGFLRRIDMRISEGRFDTTNLNLPYLKELWGAQRGKCAFTNVDLILPHWSGNATVSKNYLASLDRIDSSKGYVMGNVQFVSVSVNWLKNNLNASHVEEFFHIVRNNLT
jgi:hypothetical protein